MSASWGHHPLKRFLDILGALTLLLLLTPLLILLSVCSLFLQGSPLFFKQTRPGKGGTLFTLTKFRSMQLGRGTDGDRMSGWGRFLRRFGLDELPELWNILKGDMSFVGPRPLLPEYLPRYNETQARRHEVRPGLTGWAQIHGRNTIDWEQKFELDVWYVDHASPGLDLKVLFLTVTHLLQKNDGDQLIGPFLGNAEEDEQTRQI